MNDQDGIEEQIDELMTDNLSLENKTMNLIDQLDNKIDVKVDDLKFNMSKMDTDIDLLQTNLTQLQDGYEELSGNLSKLFPNRTDAISNKIKILYFWLIQDALKYF